MRLATIRTGGATAAVRVDGDGAVELGAADLGEFLARLGWRDEARDTVGERHDLDALDYAPLVPRPEKVLCVGLNYRTHILEMGRELPTHPTLFGKFARTLIGAYDDIALPAGSEQVDWEAELGVVICHEVRHAGPDEARAAIAGYTVINDVTARDFQNRTKQWLQGKMFEATTPVGPWLETETTTSAAISCTVDGEQMQKSDISDLVFDPVALVEYISAVITLAPGDLIATGTPGGVGHARNPTRYLGDGSEVVTRIDGIGQCRNTCRYG